MIVAIDTNVLAYAEGIGNVTRRDATMELLTRLPPENILLPVQTLGELFRVLTRPSKLPAGCGPLPHPAMGGQLRSC